MRVTEYRLRGPIRKRIVLLADIHGDPMNTELVERQEPELIAIAGDLQTVKSGEGLRKETLELLAGLRRIAPTFYALGNHETRLTPGDCRRVRETGTELLEDRWVPFDDLLVGGLSSASRRRFMKGTAQREPLTPDLDFAGRFAAEKGYKLLICHHPEYYDWYLRELDIDLVLSGHAHGGQIRLFGQGLYAPGQGLFPKRTKGVYDGRLVVSAGMANTGGIIPRLFNPTELVAVTIE